jgi:Inverse autotransporter, beta-domain
VTGFADVLQPLFYSPGRAALFYDGRFSYDDDQQEVQSHGLVFRYRVPDRDIIIGANVYYNSVDSRHDHHFDELGLGIEVLTKWVDFHANYYLPDQKRERVDQRRDMLVEPPRVEVIPVRREVGGTIGGEVVTQQISFVQFSPSSFQRRELTQFESPLEGLDTELGFLIPGINRYAEVRVFGGYYHYLNPFGSDYDGFKARLEARIRRGLTAEVEYRDDQSLNGGHWTGSVRVSVPFNLGNIFAGRNPFEGASEAFGPPSGDFGDRMTDLVIRSHRIKTTTSGFQVTALQSATSIVLKREGGRLVAIPIFDGEGSKGTTGDVIGLLFADPFLAFNAIASDVEGNVAQRFGLSILEARSQLRLGTNGEFGK